jgi:hypothetical protein
MLLVVSALTGLAWGLARGGGRGLAGFSLRAAWVPLAAFGLQAVLVHFPVIDGATAAWLGPIVLGLTYLALVVFLWINRSLPGVRLLLAGALLNFAVILANGGYMPVTVEALARSGHLDKQVERGGQVFVVGSKDVVLDEPQVRLGILGDIFSLPLLPPLGSSYSAGDLLIALGAAQLDFFAMVGPRQGAGVRSPGTGGLLGNRAGGFEGSGDQKRRRGMDVCRDDASPDREGADRYALS